MIEKNNVDGKIIKINKLWWLKINQKNFRTTPLDGATFPYKVKIEYNVNGVNYSASVGRLTPSLSNNYMVFEVDENILNASNTDKTV